MFSDLSGDQKGKLLMNAAKVVPSIIGFGAAAKANAKQQGYLDDIRKLEGQRQTLVNPYAKISNPYQNLAVATRAAEMQAEQTDLALANTLDQLRQTGAGGATALAQAALKSKQGISANIQSQEVANQQLEAKGQLQADIIAAKGQAGIMGMQERREEAQLDRLQGLADIEAMQRAGAFSTGIGALTSGLSGAAQAFIKPKAQDFGNNIQIGSGFDSSQLYNNSDQAYSDLMQADLNQMIEEDLGSAYLEDDEMPTQF